MKKLEINDKEKDVLLIPLIQTERANLTTLRKIDKLEKKVRDANGVVELDDDDFTYIKQAFDNFSNWNAKIEARIMIFAVKDKLDEAEKT